MSSDGKKLDKLIWLKDVGVMIGGYSKRTVERMINVGELPPPVYVRKRACLPESAVIAYIEHQKQEARNDSVCVSAKS